MNDSIKLSMNGQPNTQSDRAHQEQLAPVRKSTLRKIFIGTHGLRAGWSLIIFIALMATLLKSMTAIGNLVHLFPKKSATDTEITPGFLFYAESLPLLATLLATWIMSRIEKRPHSIYGLGGKRTFPASWAAWPGDLPFSRSLSSLFGRPASSPSIASSSMAPKPSATASSGF